MDIVVTSSQSLRVGDRTLRCTVGRGGFVAEAEKREGDLKTPIGSYALWTGWYRPDRVTLQHPMLHPMEKEQGWCDAPADADYNQPVTSPHAASCETLWRDDAAYDILFPTSHNQSPVIPGHGSALFFHLAQPDYRGTEGCVAIAKTDMLAILPDITPDSRLVIQPE